MSEAYEIGVTLALGDGVSTGLAQARKDTAQLERVLLAGGVSVQQLRAASMLALSATRAVPQVAKAVERAPAQVRLEENGPAAAGIAVMPAAGPASVRYQDAARPAEAAAPAISATRASVETAVAAAPVRMDPLPPLASPYGLAPRPKLGDVPSQIEDPARPEASQDVLQVSAPISLAAIGVAARAERPQPAPVGFGVEPQRVMAGSPAEVPSVTAPEMRVADPANSASAPPWILDQAPQPVWMPPGASDNAGEAGRSSTGPIAPAAAPERPVAAPQGSAAASAVSQAPAAPLPGAASSGPTEGDVFLDGALVGRWMSRLLSQEAGRASAGPTGFDPRRGRLLPGATVGG